MVKQRDVKTSIGDARSLIAAHRNRNRDVGLYGTSRPINDSKAVADRDENLSGLVRDGDISGEISDVF